MPSTLNSLAWKFSESILSQIVSFIVSIVIARILGPSEYGVVAMVMVFTTIAQVFVDGGFNSALVQKKNADILDFSTVLFFSLCFSIVLYTLLFFLAPFISNFYGNQYDQLAPVLRVLGLTLIIFAVNSVQAAYVQKKMLFKNFFWARLVGTVISGVSGIIMALMGYGVWALVAQHIIASVINTFTLFFVTKKTPILAFSFSRLRGLMGFGLNVLASNVLIRLYVELRSLIIGKLYSASDLACFNRGKQYSSLLMSNIDGTLGSVLYPRMVIDQDDFSKVKNFLRKSLRTSMLLTSPLLMGLAAMGEPLIRLMLTDKWIESVPYLQIFCFTNLFMPLSNVNNQAIRAIGKSNAILKVEVVRKVIELIALLIVMRMGVMAIAINMLVMNAILTFANAYPNVKYLKYTYREQIKDILPGFLMSAIMFGLMFSINYTGFNDVVKIILELIVGFVSYCLMARLSNNTDYEFVKSLIKEKFLKKK